jgi:glycosyltransferase involved in cell wall biosynthesis
VTDDVENGWGGVTGLRVAVLTKGWTGYLDTPFVKLAERGVQLMVVSPTSMEDTAFSGHAIDRWAETVWWTSEPDGRQLVEQVSAFRPDAVIVHSWEVAPYRAVLKAMPPHVVRVLWMDNVWLGTPKQFAGRLVSRFYVQPVFDVALVPSDRTEFFARRLGFGPDQVIRGASTADTDLFGAGPHTGEQLLERRLFISALRLVHHKGADVLAEAYARYRTLVSDPWDLAVVGIGPLASSFDGIDGVHMHGFLQPEELAPLMAASSCYINPSRMEPYAVVLHEAAAASLPILTTDIVGAGPTMVQDGYNGWVVKGSDPEALASAMARMSSLDAPRLTEMSDISHRLSSRMSPTGWARNLHEELVRRTRQR